MTQIEFIPAGIPKSPARSPSAELVDDRLQFAPGRSQAVFGPLAPRGTTPLARLQQPSGHVRKRGRPRSSSLK
jgi:hypothetical protein